MQSGSARTPLIIAGIAALLTYAIAGQQTPFGFLHSIHLMNHRHASAKPDIAIPAMPAIPALPADATQAAKDAAQERADAAQQAADAHRETSENNVRSLAPFDSVVIEDDADAAVTIGDTQSVSVSAPDGRVGQITTSVHDGKLVVSSHGTDAHVRVTVPHLRALQVNGAGQVSLDGLRDPITIKTNGPVHLSASGAVDSADLTLNGPSKLLLAKLETKNMTIRLNGVGDAEVCATQTLNADVHGIGRVRYLGDPKTVSTIHGLGSVEKLPVTHEG